MPQIIILVFAAIYLLIVTVSLSLKLRAKKEMPEPEAKKKNVLPDRIADDILMITVQFDACMYTDQWEHTSKLIDAFELKYAWATDLKKYVGYLRQYGEETRNYKALINRQTLEFDI